MKGKQGVRRSKSTRGREGMDTSREREEPEGDKAKQQKVGKEVSRCFDAYTIHSCLFCVRWKRLVACLTSVMFDGAGRVKGEG